MRNIRIEVDPTAEEEIVIRCKQITDEVEQLRRTISGNGYADPVMNLRLQDREYFVPLSEILFFESSDDKTSAHTKTRMLYTDKTLRQLEATLPFFFLRISKSCIVNANLVTSLSKSLSGVCKVYLGGETHIVYASRMYYKQFRERLTAIKHSI